MLYIAAMPTFLVTCPYRMDDAERRGAFDRLLDGLKKRFTTDAQIAEATGVDVGSVSRWRTQRTMDVSACFRIALALQWPAGEVLRAANKDDLAGLLDELYPRGETMTLRTKRLVDLFTTMEEGAQDSILGLLEHWPRQGHEGHQVPRRAK